MRAAINKALVLVGAGLVPFGIILGILTWEEFWEHSIVHPAGYDLQIASFLAIVPSGLTALLGSLLVFTGLSGLAGATRRRYMALGVFVAALVSIVLYVYSLYPCGFSPCIVPPVGRPLG